jgi:hypothetical protein
MYVKQVSVFLENRKGSLTDLTRTLSDNGIDLIALSIADTEQYGILRCIMTDMEKGVKALKDAGYVVRITDVLAVCVPDRPGGLNAVLEKLTEHDISIEYVYSFVRSTGSTRGDLPPVGLLKGSRCDRGRRDLLEQQVRSL